MYLRRSAQPWAITISLGLLGASALPGTAFGTPTPTEESPTPTDGGATPPSPQVFAPGEVEISELMIAPAGNANAEWVEFRSLVEASRTLDGCYILSAAESGESATCDPLGTPGSCSAITPFGIDAVLGGETGLLQRNSYISDNCETPVYGGYAFAVSLSNSEEETISLHCPAEGDAFEEVAALTFDWAANSGDSGQSLSVDPEGGQRCLSPQSEPFCTIDDTPNYGTPGLPNGACAGDPTPTPDGPTPTAPTAPAPRPGEVIFNELMIAPATGASNEWVELKSQADEAIWLGACYLLKESSTISSTCEALGLTGRCAPIEGNTTPAGPGELLVFERDDGLSETCGIAVDGHYDGGDIALGNSATETIALYCPLPEGGYERVTETTYDFSSSGADRGQSLIPDPESGGLCPASSAEGAYCSVEGDLDIGSPGEDNPGCDFDDPTTPPETPTPEGTPPEAPRPLPGDLVFSELMIAPDGGSTSEYIEVLNTQDESRWLGGCYLLKTSDDITSTCDELGEAGRCEPLDGAGRLVLDTGDIALFTRGESLIENCGLTPDATYGSNISLSNSGEETLSLLCPNEDQDGYRTIASLTYQWTALGGENGQSIGLNGAQLDDTPLFPDDYCLADTEETEPFCLLGDDEAPNYGSPGEYNPACPEPDPLPGAGDVIFSELMIAPLDSGREWMELEVINLPDGGEWNLKGCQLIEGDCKELEEGQFCLPESLCEEDNCGGNWSDPQTFTGDIPLSSEGPTVISKSGDCIAGDGSEVEDDEACTQTSAGTYSTISLTNSDPGVLYLLCPAGDEGSMEIVDRISYDWSRDEVGCGLDGNNGCSYSLRPEALESTDPATTNDEPDAWCVSGPDSVYNNEKGALAYGTPGAPNLCADASCADPSSISLVFTEVLIGPIPSSYSNAEEIRVHEWFEWVNVGGEADLGCCYLEVLAADDRGTDDANPSTFSLQGTDPVPAASREVWAQEGCLISERNGDEEFCIDDERTNVTGVRAYSGLSFSNSSPQYLSLYCSAPGGRVELIDEFLYDYAILPTPEGRSYQLTEAGESAAGNDDPANWCGAPLTEEGIYVSTETGPNFGSPGSINTCAPLGEINPGVAGCTCRLDTIQGEGTELRATFTALILMFLGLGLRRRRP